MVKYRKTLVVIALVLLWSSLSEYCLAATFTSCTTDFTSCGSSVSNATLNAQTSATWTGTAAGCGTSSGTASSSYSGGSRYLTWWSSGYDGSSWTYWGSSGSNVYTSTVTNCSTGARSANTYSILQSVIYGYRNDDANCVDQVQAVVQR